MVPKKVVHLAPKPKVHIVVKPVKKVIKVVTRPTKTAKAKSTHVVDVALETVHVNLRKATKKG